MSIFSELEEKLKASSASGKAQKVCLVTPELVEFYQNGGIGTATSGLIKALRKYGHEITVFYTGDAPETLEKLQQNSSWWNPVKGLEAAGVKILFLTQLYGKDYLWPRRKASYACYDYLKKNNFDIIHFNDYQGNGYYTASAKKSGLNFSKSTIIVTIHGTTSWAMEADKTGPSSIDDVEQIWLENKSIEMSDIVIGVSHHLLQWLEDHGVVLPPNSYVHKNCHPPIPAIKGSPLSRESLQRIVFFGRMDARKGVDTFVSAIKKFAPQHPDIAIEFLGRFSHIDGEHSAGYVLQRLSNIPNSIQFNNKLGRDGALRNLCQAGTLAVMPSHDENSPCVIVECQSVKIPFIASNVGGSYELLLDSDRKKVLFSPDSEGLLSALNYVWENGLPEVKPNRSADDISLTWAKLHNAIARGEFPTLHKNSQAFDGPPPLVSVCITHYRRPWYLPQLITAIEAQSYDNIEIILVDDCSNDSATDNILENLEKRETSRFPLKIIRRAENGYLGAARNSAAEQSSGVYIKFQDDDNLPLPTEINSMVRAAMLRNADVVTSFAYQFSGRTPETPKFSDVQYFPLGDCAPLAFIRNEFGDANALIRRSSFDKINGFSEDSGVGAEDYEFFAKILSTGGNIIALPEPLFFYRVSSSSMLQTGSFSANASRARRGFSKMPADKFSILSEVAANSVIKKEIDGAAWWRVGKYSHGELHQQLIGCPVNGADANQRIVEILRLMGRTTDALKQRLLDYSVDNTVDWLKFMLNKPHTLGSKSPLLIELSDCGNVLESMLPLTSQLPDYWGKDWKTVDCRDDGILVHPIRSLVTTALLRKLIPSGARSVTVRWFHANAAGDPAYVRVGVSSGEESEWTKLDVGQQPLDITLPINAAVREGDLMLSSRTVTGDYSAWAVARFVRVIF